MGYVLEGAPEPLVGGAKGEGGDGRFFFFNSSLPHRYRNCGPVEAKVLWVNTPPSI
jgi:Cupin domain